MTPSTRCWLQQQSDRRDKWKQQSKTFESKRHRNQKLFKKLKEHTQKLEQDRKQGTGYEPGIGLRNEVGQALAGTKTWKRKAPLLVCICSSCGAIGHQRHSSLKCPHNPRHKSVPNAGLHAQLQQDSNEQSMMDQLSPRDDEVAEQLLDIDDEIDRQMD